MIRGARPASRKPIITLGCPQSSCVACLVWRHRLLKREDCVSDPIPVDSISFSEARATVLSALAPSLTELDQTVRLSLQERSDASREWNEHGRHKSLTADNRVVKADQSLWAAADNRAAECLRVDTIFRAALIAGDLVGYILNDKSDWLQLAPADWAVGSAGVCSRRTADGTIVSTETLNAGFGAAGDYVYPGGYGRSGPDTRLSGSNKPNAHRRVFFHRPTFETWIAAVGFECVSKLLDGLLVGEAIRELAFHHPLVQAARSDLSTYNRTKGQLAAFSGIFNCGSFLWPLNLTVGDLDGFFRPQILHDMEHSWGPLPAETKAAFHHIAACFASIAKAVRTNTINVLDMDNKPVHATVWQRPGIVINLNTSDLYDVVNGSVPLRRGLWLSVASVPSPAAETSSRYPRSELCEEIERSIQACSGGPMDKRTEAYVWIQRRAMATTKFEQAVPYVGEDWLKEQGYEPGDEIDTNQLRGFIASRFHPTGSEGPIDLRPGTKRNPKTMAKTKGRAGEVNQKIAARSAKLNSNKPKTTDKGAVLQKISRSRGGRREVYDGDRLRKDLILHLKSNVPFLYSEDFVSWCCENVHPKRGMEQPVPNQFPDPKTIKALIARHKLDEIEGLFAKR